jgi:hypothetical protein
MRTLIYKRTHTGDPDPASGVFGNHHCMGQVRGWPFDAVIGVGGIGKYAQSEGIAGLLTWIGIGAHKTGDLSRPRITFDHFWCRDEGGPVLDKIAPNLARRIYGKNVRMIMSSSLSEKEAAEVASILKLARRAPPSGRSASTRNVPGKRTCGKGGSSVCVRPPHIDSGCGLTFDNQPTSFFEAYNSKMFEDLVALADRMVRESGNAAGFSAEAFVVAWLEQPHPALGGCKPAMLLDTDAGRQKLFDLLAAQQSSAYV